MKKKTLFVILLLSFIFTIPARADVAPPEKPPGADIVPGDEATQVRMVAETVTLTVDKNTPEGELGDADTVASFTMRNLGDSAETMAVRFPLTFWNGQSDGFFKYPEIRDISVFVNGFEVGTRRVTTKNYYDDDGPEIPWASFDVMFPPDKDVTIEVKYTTDGFGDWGDPFIVFRYVLQTGAGWQGTIGSADIIVRYPYEVNAVNILLDSSPGFGFTSPNATLSGKEVSWHFEDFEPTREHDIEIVLISPASWNKVLREEQNLTENPNDGEAWGRLGLAYKNIIRFRRGTREDPGGMQAYERSVAAYEKAVTLLPDDAVWHYGFADLLWSKVAWSVYPLKDEVARQTMLRCFAELDQSLALDPNDERTLRLAEDIYYWVPEYLEMEGNEFIFHALTATPALATVASEPTATSPPPSPTPEPTSSPVPTDTLPPTATTLPTQTETVATDVPLPTAVAPEESSSSPLCGGALIMPLFAGLFWISARKQK